MNSRISLDTQDHRLTHKTSTSSSVGHASSTNFGSVRNSSGLSRIIATCWALKTDYHMGRREDGAVCTWFTVGQTQER